MTYKTHHFPTIEQGNVQNLHMIVLQLRKKHIGILFSNQGEPI